jgi:hypothetical protein
LDLWRKRFNCEIERLFKEKDIIIYAKTKILQWLGHLERMEEALEKFSRASARDKEKEEDQLRDGWMRLKRALRF